MFFRSFLSICKKRRLHVHPLSKKLRVEKCWLGHTKCFGKKKTRKRNVPQQLQIFCFCVTWRLHWTIHPSLAQLLSDARKSLSRLFSLKKQAASIQSQCHNITYPVLFPIRRNPNPRDLHKRDPQNDGNFTFSKPFGFKTNCSMYDSIIGYTNEGCKITKSSNRSKITRTMETIKIFKFPETKLGPAIAGPPVFFG